MNDQLTNRVIEIITQLQTSAPLATKHSMDMALQVITYGGFINILYGIISISIALLFSKMIMTRLKKSIYELDEVEGNKEVASAFISLLLSFGLLVAWLSILILGIQKLINIWNYIALINPKIYLAHQIIERVTS